jgi:hypothetical protein
MYFILIIVFIFQYTSITTNNNIDFPVISELQNRQIVIFDIAD